MTNHKPDRRLPAFVKPYNSIVRRFAGRIVYALLRHQGRKSGRVYETPVMAWPTSSGMLIPLAWGVESDWYRNLLAANACAVQIGGRWYRCAEPVRIQRDQAIALLPPAARIVVQLSPIPVAQFVLLRRMEIAT
jgi:deazaflavin-dependent oxidoreductase (nitroreductase family)